MSSIQIADKTDLIVLKNVTPSLISHAQNPKSLQILDGLVFGLFWNKTSKDIRGE